jgi:hypothetical protein
MTTTEPAAATCGHEYELGAVSYACERPPHPVDGYGPAFRHAAEIDVEPAKGSLVTWGEDGNGGGQDWGISWDVLADYGASASPGTCAEAATDEQESDTGLFRMVPVDNGQEG